MIKPPQATASITKPSITDQEAIAPETTISWGGDLSAYEILRREGEIHEGHGTVLDELRRNMTHLEDLHGQLHFLLREVGSLLRVRS